MFLSILLVWPVLSLVQLSLACMETAWKYGYLSGVNPIHEQLTTGTCACCGLCYQFSECASFSYGTDGTCRLYDTVARYDTLIPDKNWLYFVKPGKSGHHQFCRQDSDCTAKNDSCRGRVCTPLSTITCQTIKKNFNPSQNVEVNWNAHGWIKDRPMELTCWKGYTLIFKMQRGRGFTNTTLWDLNSGLNLDGEPNYSILSLTENMLQLSGEEYSLTVYVRGHVWLEFTVPRDSPVIGSAPRPGTVIRWSGPQSWKLSELSLPYVVSAGNELLSVQLDGGSDGAIATKNGDLGSWFNGFHTTTLYLREQN